jgi:hypothetical protein
LECYESQANISILTSDNCLLPNFEMAHFLNQNKEGDDISNRPADSEAGQHKHGAEQPINPSPSFAAG